MPHTKRKNKSSKLSIQKRWCTETKTENNMEISEHNSNVAQHSSANSIFKNERVSMQEKSVLEQENVADTYDGSSYIIVDKNALCDIFKYTFCDSCNQSTLKLEFEHKYGFSHQLKMVCKTCSEQKMECFTYSRLEKKSNTSTPFDVNVRAVQAFLAIIGGHASVEKFCMFLNIPLMSTLKEIQKAVNLVLGEEAVKIAATRDYRRKKERNRQNNLAFRIARRKVKLANLRKEKYSKKKEGITYSPGFFF
ncbi:uncharacterized protein TNIN_157331 [Trichonephila inaurata madagascariensis]|uniref:Mutator-like transposase domain-containing protein n=1 Tax=Trichonephila inaurata madagascariensis TaxID=2747483 RepID=A0A8X7CKG4_9ARAC|nr:uncharacterized protein TNIN_157331 [Trichonephila inaurata madagascariensis]